jgi:hypothetical protein
MKKALVPSWKLIVNRWTALHPEQKLIALVIRARTGKTGVANLSIGDLQDATGFVPRTIHDSIDQLKSKKMFDCLTVEDTELKRRKNYTLRHSGNCQGKRLRRPKKPKKQNVSYSA